MTKEASTSPAEAGAASAPVYNPMDASFDVYKFFDWARRNDPVHFSPLFQARLVTRYDDIVAVTKDPRRYSSVDFMKPYEPWPDEVVALIAAEGFPVVPTLVDSDPPAHMRIRSLFSAAFTPRRVEQMESRVRAIAHELIDGFAQDGQADVLARLAFRLPMTVITDMLGVPREDIDRVKAWHDDVISMYGVGIPLEQRVAWARGLIAYQRYYEAMLLERKRQPRDDLATALVQAQVDGAHFSMAEMIWQMIILMSAGHETTTNLIANMLYCLLTHPEQWRALDNDPGLLPAAVEETLRREAPIKFEPRTTTEDVELSGVPIPKGARLHVMYASAGRDPAVFPDPDRFDIFREGNRKGTSGHLSFGHGIHFCLGAPLARLEGRIALEVLRQRLPNLRLAPGFTPEWLPHPLFRALRTLPLQWDVS